MAGSVAEARVATPAAKRYLGQLCKHFAHRLTVTLDETHGRIEFDAGPCEVTADDAALHLRVSAATAEALARLEDVVARHLVRFAFREELIVEWVSGTTAPAPEA